MLLIVSLLAGVVIVILGLLATLPLVQAVAATARRAPGPDATVPVRPRVAILIPAHDEAAGIGATLSSLHPQLVPGDRLVVVADNCTDDTATVAAALGATVVVRNDPGRRGKGYALAFGFDGLRADPPDVLLMFDADCEAEVGCVSRLASAAWTRSRPIQARYLLTSPDRGVRSRLSEFAFRVRNLVRPLGMARLGLPCQLMGSGMAFRWSILESVSLASGHLTEDLELGLFLARQGRSPHFCPDAVVSSHLASDPAAAQTQRTRWVHGHLAMVVAELPRLVGAALRRRDAGLLMMAWDLAVPPFALFVAAVLAFIVLFGALALIGGPAWPLAGVVLVLATTVATMVVAQRGFARDLIRLHEIFVTAPLYLAGKLPAYLRFAFRRQVEWVRTRRDAG